MVKEGIRRILKSYFSQLIHYQYRLNDGVKDSREEFRHQEEYLMNKFERDLKRIIGEFKCN